MVKIISNGSGGTDWNQLGATLASVLTGGDQLTPALKRAQMRNYLASAEKDELSNQGNRDTAAVLGEMGLEAALRSGDRRLQSALALANGGDVDKLLSLGRGITAANPNNPLTGEAIARSIVGAGGNMSATPMGFSQDQAR